MFGIIAAGISAVSDLVGSAISVISTVGPAVGTFAKGIIDLVVKMPGIDEIGKIAETVGFIARVVHEVADLLGIKSEDDPEVLGAKASQEGVETIDEFDNDAEAYIKYLREEVELDKKKFEQMSEEERLGCKAVGLSLETKAIENKIGGIEISEESLVALAKIAGGSELDIDPKELLEIVKALKSAGITNMQDVSDYLEGKGENRLETGEALVGALGTEAEERIVEMKNAVRNYGEV